MRFEGPNSHPYTRKTGNADFLGAWMRQAQRVSSVANVCSEHLLLHHTVPPSNSLSVPLCLLATHRKIERNTSQISRAYSRYVEIKIST